MLAARTVVSEPRQDHRRLGRGPPPGEAHAQVVERLQESLHPCVHVRLTGGEVQVMAEWIRTPWRRRATCHAQAARECGRRGPDDADRTAQALRGKGSSTRIRPEQTWSDSLAIRPDRHRRSPLTGDPDRHRGAGGYPAAKDVR